MWISEKITATMILAILLMLTSFMACEHIPQQVLVSDIPEDIISGKVKSVSHTIDFDTGGTNVVLVIESDYGPVTCYLVPVQRIAVELLDKGDDVRVHGDRRAGDDWTYDNTVIVSYTAN